MIRLKNETITILKTIQLPPTSFTSDFSFDDVTGCYALERKKVKGGTGEGGHGMKST